MSMSVEITRKQRMDKLRKQAMLCEESADAYDWLRDLVNAIEPGTAAQARAIRDVRSKLVEAARTARNAAQTKRDEALVVQAALTAAARADEAPSDEVPSEDHGLVWT